MKDYRNSDFFYGVYLTLLIVIAIMFLWATVDTFYKSPEPPSLIWLLFFGLWLLFLFKPMREMLYDYEVFIVLLCMGMTIISFFETFFVSFPVIVFAVIVDIYCGWLYYWQRKIKEKSGSSFFPIISDSDGMTSYGRYEFHEWQHTLEELRKAQTALHNLEAQRKNMPEEEFESERRYLQSRVDAWQRMSDEQYRVYKQADR